MHEDNDWTLATLTNRKHFVTHPLLQTHRQLVYNPGVTGRIRNLYEKKQFCAFSCVMI